MDNPNQLQLCRVDLEKIKVLETKMKAEVEAAEQRVEVEKLRQDSVTSDVSSSDEEEEELFNPGRLGWSDSPDLVAWRFADYPEEEEDEEGSEEDYEDDWEVSCQPAWLRISSEQLKTSLHQQQEDFRSPLTSQGSPYPGLRRSLSCVEISSPLNTTNYPNVLSSLSNSPSNRLSSPHTLNTSSLEDLSFVEKRNNPEGPNEEKQENVMRKGKEECCDCYLKNEEETQHELN